LSGFIVKSGVPLGAPQTELVVPVIEK